MTTSMISEFINMIAGGSSNRHYTSAITWLTRRPGRTVYGYG